MTRPARAPSPPPRAYLSIGSIVVDNIVLPDARTRMGVLGGGARHAAIGMRVWTERVGLLAAAGRDLPASDRLALERAVDLHRLPRGDALSPRVWQLSEDDGRRTHLDRTDADLFMAMCPRPDEFPADYAGVAGVRLECDAPDRSADG